MNAVLTQTGWTGKPNLGLTQAQRDALLLKWQNAKTALEAAKTEELQLRNEVISQLFDNNNDNGTENYPLGNGFKLKAVKKLSYSLDKELTDAALDKIEKLDAQGKFFAERLVKWSPSLSVSEYKQLPEQYRAIIDTVLTISPATPSLELVEPKANK